MKKFFAIILTICLVAAVLAGCGSSTPQTTAAPTTTKAPETKAPETQAPQTTEAPATEAPLDFGDKYLTMLTGSTGGAYYPIGIIFSTLWNEHLGSAGLNVSGQASAGGVENLNMLKSGEADLGLAVSDFGYYSYTGTAMFDGKGEHKELRGICGLWPELVHMVVTEASGINSLQDAVGHRLSIGGAGSGMAYNTPIMMKVLANAEINTDWTPEYLAFQQSSEAMQNGQIDGVNITGGVPVSSATELMASSIGTKILSFSQEDCDKLNSLGYTQFGLYTIPANTYNNQPEDLTTLGYKCELFCTADLDEEVVYNMTKVLFEYIDEIRASHKALSTIDAKTCLNGLADTPLHPGAIRYFEEIGVTIPENLK
ncbi:MAG: TAXI family TRAP transporter solute-binding subunit [Lachnospiraceae bacterium]|nr:TAXI family TRAP transporter solute-binding subunit [Lachnospiraceae bacterium]